MLIHSRITKCNISTALVLTPLPVLQTKPINIKLGKNETVVLDFNQQISLGFDCTQTGAPTTQVDRQLLKWAYLVDLTCWQFVEYTTFVHLRGSDELKHLYHYCVQVRTHLLRTRNGSDASQDRSIQHSKKTEENYEAKNNKCYIPKYNACCNWFLKLPDLRLCFTKTREGFLRKQQSAYDPKLKFRCNNQGYFCTG